MNLSPVTIRLPPGCHSVSRPPRRIAAVTGTEPHYGYRVAPPWQWVGLRCITHKKVLIQPILANIRSSTAWGKSGLRPARSRGMRLDELLAPVFTLALDHPARVLGR